MSLYILSNNQILLNMMYVIKFRFLFVSHLSWTSLVSMLTATEKVKCGVSTIEGPSKETVYLWYLQGFTQPVIFLMSSYRNLKSFSFSSSIILKQASPVPLDIYIYIWVLAVLSAPLTKMGAWIIIGQTPRVLGQTVTKSGQPPRIWECLARVWDLGKGRGNLGVTSGSV